MLTGFYLLAMLLVPYPFASILSIVFPSLRFLRNLHPFIFGLRAVYSFACFASQTQGLCSAFPRPSLEFVRFCLSRIVLRTSPHKHRVCAVLFPRSPLKFVRLCLLCYVMLCYAYFASQTSGLCSAFALGSLLSLYGYVSRFVIRTSPHKLRVCAVLAPRFPLEFCTRAFSCLACFASQTPGLCSALPSAPFEFIRLCLSRFVMRTLPHKHRVCAVLFSPHSQKIRTRDHAPVLI